MSRLEQLVNEVFTFLIAPRPRESNRLDREEVVSLAGTQFCALRFKSSLDIRSVDQPYAIAIEPSADLLFPWQLLQDLEHEPFVLALVSLVCEIAMA